MTFSLSCILYRVKISSWRSNKLIVMRRASCTVSSGLKLVFYLGSLLPSLFPFIIRSSWMTLFLYVFARHNFPHLIPLFKTVCCFPIASWIQSIVLYFTKRPFLSWACFLSLAPIRIVLYNWLNLIYVPYTNYSNPCLHAFDHALSVLECTSPILLYPFHAHVFHEDFLDSDRLGRLNL